MKGVRGDGELKRVEGGQVSGGRGGECREGGGEVL